MVAYNIIKKVVGFDKFYSNLQFYKKLASESQKACYCVTLNDNKLFKKGEVYDALNCYLVEFIIEGVIYSFFIDTFCGTNISELTDQKVQETGIINSIKYSYKKY